MVPLKVLEDGIDERGKRWFAYAPVHLPGAVYIIVFDKTQKWLPVSYRHHYHPLLVQKTKTADLQAVFEYRNWRIGKEAVADLFDVEKFEKQQFPGEEYFVKIREALGKEGEE